ncbi:MAG: PAS domain S-box protein [Deinococcales bacterium]|nr:PAS domain S-box protein [Chitinophagaceae bacterium]
MKKNNELKILVIDDDEDDYFIICDYLKGFTTYNLTVDWCHSYNDGFTKIMEREYAIYLIDYRLSIKTGLDLITNAVKAGCQEPMILLTGKGNSEIDMGAMKAGAIDYLIKSELSTEKLERSIRYAIERNSSIKLIREKERRFRSIFENSTDTIFITDSEGNIKQINKAGSNLLQLPENLLIQKNIFDYLGNTDTMATFSKTLTIQHEIKDIEVAIVTNDGVTKDCLLSISLETDDYKQPYFQGMIHDITERKRIENNSVQVEKLAAAGRFMRTLAHEVRNPLNNINLAVEQLQHDNTENEDEKMFLEIIHRNSSRINSLITELLQSLKESSIVKKEVALHDIIDEVISITKDKAALKNIKLVFNNCAVTDYILADKNKITLALLNLVNNSIEAIENKEGIIVFETNRNVLNKITLTIADNGNGMSEENRRRLFEPYYTTKRNGMGLGMVSTLNILQSHNASIVVESTISKGTKCIIVFN